MQTIDMNKLQDILASTLQKHEIEIRAQYDPVWAAMNLNFSVLDKIVEHFGDVSNMPKAELITRVRQYTHMARGHGESFNPRDVYKTPTKHIQHMLEAVCRFHERERERTGAVLSGLYACNACHFA